MMPKEECEVVVLGAPGSPAPEATTVISIPSDVRVPDHVVWSIFNIICLNTCCLGFIAFAFSIKSRDRKMVGDVIGAQSYASTAKCLNISALLLNIIVAVVFLLLYATAIIAAIRSFSQIKKDYQGY